MNQIDSKKILIVSTYDCGGAGEGMLKFAYFLKDFGHEVLFLVKYKSKSDVLIVQYSDLKPFYQKIFYFILNKIKNFISTDKVVFDEKYYFNELNESKQNVNVHLIAQLLKFKPQFIFSGWTAGFMNSTDLLNLQRKFGSQVYTVSIDMNHYTGGCHYAWDCKGYINGCNNDCPAIISKADKGLAKSNFETKLKNANTGNFKILSGSGWTLKQSKESLIYKNQTDFFNFNSMIDTRIMNPNNRTFAKNIFNLDSDKFYILMGCQDANDPRKGFEYLVESLNLFYQNLDTQHRDKIRVLIVSSTKKENHNIPFETTFLDFVSDYRLLSLLYQASDVFVNSSVEDSGPMMVSEALACGTPVVGFDMGVVNNMVINHYNGYKATLRDSEDLAKGIKIIFQLTPTEYKLYSQNSVLQIKEYSSFEYGAEIFNEIFKN